MSGIGDTKRAKIDQGTVCPCTFSTAAQALNVHEALGLDAAKAAHRVFLKEYAVKLTAFDQELWDAIRVKPLDGLIAKECNAKVLPTMHFPYVSLVNGSAQPHANDMIFTNILRDCKRIAVVFLPGANTPVCSSMHVPSFLDAEVLKEMKTAGIDAVLFVTADTPDDLCKWLRDLAASKGLLHLIPDALPAQDVNAKLTLNADMPVLLPVSDLSLALANVHGVVTQGRLGLFAHRACALYEHGQFKEIIKPIDSSATHCTAVTARAVLDRFSVSFDSKVSPKL